MDYRVSPADRSAFKRCRRQWDLSAASRRNLQPLEPDQPGLEAALRDALAMYYYPGMWDWLDPVVLPLVRKAFMRRMASAPSSAGRTADVDLGTALLEHYFVWAPGLDDFCPLWIETDVESLVPDVREPSLGLLTPDGHRVVYEDRIALLAVDAADECWVVRHHVVTEWHSLESLLLDEAAVTACWAWEQTYLGMDIAGTIHNEIRPGPGEATGKQRRETRTGRPGRGGISHNEPSGGGRLVPQLQRPARRQEHLSGADRVRQETAGMIRRTRIRRSRSELEEAAHRLGIEVIEMLDPGLAVYPTPAGHCAECAFVAPCLTMMEGGDPQLDLMSRFRTRPPPDPGEPRLGSGGGGGRYLPLPPTS